MPVSGMRESLAKAAAANAVEGSEDQLALDFSHRHADELRFCAAWGKWLYWDGTRWLPEATLQVLDLARAVAQAYAAALHDKKLGNSRTVHGMLSLARSDRRHAATVEQFDAGHWLLNTPGGTIELPKGQLRPALREDYITKLTAASRGSPSPLWDKFLGEIMGGDKSLTQYLQRVAGYCLTGSTREHALFYCYGTGANGKSTFLNTLAGVLGDYAQTAAMETFLFSRGERHPTDLASLRGARLVIAQEVEAGRRWNEVRIKELTGGDKVAARFMRQDFFTFTPEFKLLLAGNHKPGLARGVDEGWRRRLHLIPFVVTVPKDQRDRELLAKLKAEWAGILQWCIEGCAAWAKYGLCPPKAVVDATTAYFEDEDRVGTWITERCVAGVPGDWASIADLYTSWTEWRAAAGERPGTKKALSQALVDLGYTPQRDTTGRTRERGFARLRLKKPGE